MVSPDRKMIFNRAGRNFQNRRYFLYRKIFKIMEHKTGFFLFRQTLQIFIKKLVLERAVGGAAGRKPFHGRSLNRDFLGKIFTLAVEIAIICYTEEPGPEFRQAEKRAGSHIGPHQSILRHIISFHFIPSAQTKQESS